MSDRLILMKQATRTVMVNMFVFAILAVSYLFVPFQSFNGTGEIVGMENAKGSAAYMAEHAGGRCWAQNQPEGTRAARVIIRGNDGLPRMEKGITLDLAINQEVFGMEIGMHVYYFCEAKNNE